MLDDFPQTMDVSIWEACLVGCKISKRRKARAASSRRGSPPYILSMKLVRTHTPSFTRRIHHRFVTASLHPGPNSLISQSRLQVETCIVLLFSARDAVNHVTMWCQANKLFLTNALSLSPPIPVQSSSYPNHFPVVIAGEGCQRVMVWCTFPGHNFHKMQMKPIKASHMPKSHDNGGFKPTSGRLIKADRRACQRCRMTASRVDPHLIQ